MSWSRKLGVATSWALLMGCSAANEGPGEGAPARVEEAVVVALPARIEAESYERFYETTPASNSGGACDRGDGVDKQATTDTNGGQCNVGWTAPGEWLEYDISSPSAAHYDLVVRVASGAANTTFHVLIDGVNLGTMIATSGGWQSWQDRTYSNVSLSAGSHVLRIFFDTQDVNVNYFQFNALPSCTDGVKNGTETGVDCGGTCMACPSTSCGEQPLTRVSATASSQESSAYPAANAIDGSQTSRWSSAFSDPQSLTVDLGSTQHVSRVRLSWETAASVNYDIAVANAPAGPWTTIFATSAGHGGVENWSGLSGTGRYVRMYSRARLTPWGNSLYDLQIYGDPNPNCGTPVTRAALPWWIHYCGDVTCAPVTVRLCPDSNHDCQPTQQTTVVPEIDGHAIDQILLTAQGPDGYALYAESGSANVFGSYVEAFGSPLVVRSDQPFTVSYYGVPAALGSTTHFSLQSETFTSAEVTTTVYRYPTFLTNGEPEELHARGRTVITQESALSSIYPGPMAAYFLPTELATNIEGDVSDGQNHIAISYTNPPYIAYVGDVYAVAMPEFAHEYTHQLFAEIASAYPGDNTCLNEGLADAFPYTAGLLPEGNFGPIGQFGSDFNQGCAAAASGGEVHEIGNCPFWQVKRLSDLTTAFANAMLHPQHVINFSSCNLNDARTGNAYLVLFSEAAGTDMTQAIQLAGMPNAGSYAAAKAALGL